jgi:uncharacterized protein (DUF849 family)
MSRKVIITCAVTGGSTSSFKENPSVPITPQAIVAAGLEAVHAGASIIHVHVRDPVTGHPSHRLEFYEELTDRFYASGTAAMLNITCSMLGTLSIRLAGAPDDGAASTIATPMQRVEHALKLRPEIGTLDCGSFSIGEGIFVGRWSDLSEMARLMQAVGIKPECECFDASHIETVKRLIKAGLIEDPPWVQLCLGIYGAPAEIGILRALKEMLPKSCQWSGFGVGSNEILIQKEVIRLGGHVRVGLEDNLYLSNGDLATNVGLVNQAVSAVREAGHEVATASDARMMLACETARMTSPRQ